MAYQRFKIAELSSPSATLATFATLHGENSPSFASVATVAGPKLKTTFRSVANVASVAEAKCVSAKFAPPAPDPVTPAKPDAELYADALRTHGPTSYGAVGVILGWGMARASRAETVLRNAGRIQYDNAGRGCLVEHPSHHEQQSVGEKS